MNNISYLKQLQSKHNFTFKTLTKNGTSGGNPEYLIQSLSKQTIINIIKELYSQCEYQQSDSIESITKTYPITNQSQYKKSNYNYNHKTKWTIGKGISLCEIQEI